MATALEILPLDRMKLELSIPLAITNDDTLLIGHIGAAVDFCAHVTGLDLVDMDADEVPKQLVQAAVIMVRFFYDGFMDFRPTNAVLPLLIPLRIGYTAAA